MHKRATQQFHQGLVLLTPKEKKRNKTIYTGKLPTNKRIGNLLGFSFSYYYYNIESKLANSYN